MVEKIMFLVQIFQMKILIDLHVLRSSESVNHIILPVMKRILKQIIAEISDLAFYIYTTCRCYLKLFINIGQIVCAQGHTKDFWYVYEQN